MTALLYLTGALAIVAAGCALASTVAEGIGQDELADEASALGWGLVQAAYVVIAAALIVGALGG